MKTSRATAGFTLIELLTVIAIISILMALLFPMATGVKDQGKKTEAKNNLVSIVSAVKAYYAEYGKYPVPGADSDTIVRGSSSSGLYNTLRAIGTEALDTNPRKIVFLQGKDARNYSTPAKATGGFASDGVYYDPWGKPYEIVIDSNYDNQVDNPYMSGAGANPLRQEVIGYCLGKDGTKASTFPNSDDVISWQ
jgi:prepilin-type N-terminal cleavage/methylation domain-containing protein